MDNLQLNTIVFSPDDKNLEANWIRLYDQIRPLGISMEYAWFKSAAETCSAFSIPANVLEIRDVSTDKIVALLPYMVRQEIIYHFFKVHTLHLMRFYQQYGDHYQLLISPPYHDEAIKTLAKWISESNLDVCYLNNMAAQAKFKGIGRLPLLSAVKEKIACPFIWLPTQDKYKDWCSGKYKRIMRYKRKLEKSFKVSYFQIATHVELTEVLSQYKIMHTTRFSNKGSSSSICSDPIQFHFLERLAHNSLDRGFLVGTYIKVNDKIATAEISFLLNRRLLAYTVSFDECYSQFRIGSIQTVMMIERATAYGADVFDLLQGDEAYKQLWSKDVNFDYNVVMFPKKAYGYFLFLLTIFRVPLQNIYHRVLQLEGLFDRSRRSLAPLKIKESTTSSI